MDLTGKTKFEEYLDRFVNRPEDIDGLLKIEESEANPVQSVAVYWKGYTCMIDDPNGELYDYLMSLLTQSRATEKQAEKLKEFGHKNAVKYSKKRATLILDELEKNGWKKPKEAKP